jgi:hypothetical protein
MTFEDVKRIRENPTAEDVDNQELHRLIDIAIEKQIPKKPIKINEDYNLERGIWVADYECPSCGNPYADDSYCSCCGQALGWGDGE